MSRCSNPLARDDAGWGAIASTKPGKIKRPQLRRRRFGTTSTRRSENHWLPITSNLLHPRAYQADIDADVAMLCGPEQAWRIYWTLTARSLRRVKC